MNARETIALLLMEANLAALQEMAERTFKDTEAVIANYRAAIARMKQEAVKP
jgi:hypothetical protein